ncbi:Uncharacterized protein dnm_052930 [Desulfonema magnum]|uniref:Uncharacterized protein n=1 Tax=Desulfonema magnum TaxID=45655 RepID=A0A975BPG7_9BACT|nr:Uncharacterized protein dnm_052930 [Desulfonema magnum]
MRIDNFLILMDFADRLARMTAICALIHKVQGKRIRKGRG